jgi:hypothetical protein
MLTQALRALALCCLVGAVVAPQEAERILADQVKSRHLALRTSATAVESYAADKNHYPTASSCEHLRSLVLARYARTFSCEDGAGNDVLYIYAPEERICWPNEGDCQFEIPAASGYLLISAGRDRRLEANTLALIASRNSQTFGEKTHEMQERTRTLAWDYYIDGDVVLGEGYFIQGAYGEIGPARDFLAPHPGTLGPIKRIKRQLRIICVLCFVVFLLVAQAIAFHARRQSSNTIL